MIVTVNSIVY